MRGLFALVVGCASVASAQDLDADGCDDARAALNGACVSPDATLDPSVLTGAGSTISVGAQVGRDVELAPGVFIAPYALIAGRGQAPGPTTIGANTVVSRRVSLGSDATIGEDVVVGRATEVGTNLIAEDDVSVGYGAVVGDHVTLGERSTVGSLVTIGDWVELADDGTVARSTVIHSGTPEAPTVVAGTIGPDVVIGSGAVLSPLARVRKEATIGAGARVLGSARVGRGVVLGERAVIEDGAVVRAGVSVCNDTTVASGTYIARAEQYPGPECPCEPGFEGPPGACVDTDECATNTDDCGANTVCNNTPGSFECECAVGFVEDVGGDCVAVQADVDGDWGANRVNQAPSATLETPDTVTVSGFDGALSVDVQTTGSGPAATVQAFREGAWVDVTEVVSGDELRIRMTSAPSTGSSRNATVTLFVGPTTVWTSPTWGVTTWTYSATGISYGSCSASCGGGSRSPISWSCNRSDGTSGHSQGNCSAGGAQSCNTHSCPFPDSGDVSTGGGRTTVRDPQTNAPRYDIECRNGINGFDASTYTTVSPAGVTVNESTREITIFLFNGGSARRGYVKFRFNSGSSGLSVASFQPGAGTHRPYLCTEPSYSTPQCQLYTADPGSVNCSSNIYCRIRDRNQGSQSTMWSNSLSGPVVANCGYGVGSGAPNWLPW